jgi:hypothetical protein
MRFIYITTILATATFDKILRFDKNSAVDDNFDAVWVDVEPSTAFAESISNLTPQSSFQFTLDCDRQVSQQDCAAARQCLELAGTEIGRLLQISNPIKVKASLKPLTTGILGQAGPSSMFPVIMGGQSQNIPVALLKQLNVNKNPVLPSFDILVDFNSRQKWYFATNPATKKRDAFDFELVAAHELTHGLGFISNLGKTENIPGIGQVLVPTLVRVRGNKIAFQPPSVLDIGLRNQNSKLIDHLNKIEQEFLKSGLGLTQFRTFLAQNGVARQAARQIFQMSTSQLGYQVKDGSFVPMFTPPQFSRSSRSHLDSPFLKTPDFLMASSISNNKFKADLKLTRIYGPVTLQMLESFGWPTVNNPTVQSVQMDQDLSKRSTVKTQNSSRAPRRTARNPQSRPTPTPRRVTKTPTAPKRTRTQVISTSINLKKTPVPTLSQLDDCQKDSVATSTTVMVTPLATIAPTPIKWRVDCEDDSGKALPTIAAVLVTRLLPTVTASPRAIPTSTKVALEDECEQEIAVIQPTRKPIAVTPVAIPASTKADLEDECEEEIVAIQPSRKPVAVTPLAIPASDECEQEIVAIQPSRKPVAVTPVAIPASTKVDLEDECEEEIAAIQPTSKPVAVTPLAISTSTKAELEDECEEEIAAIQPTSKPIALAPPPDKPTSSLEDECEEEVAVAPLDKPISTPIGLKDECEEDAGNVEPTRKPVAPFQYSNSASF